MKSLLAVVALAAVVACGGRQVEVNTTPAPSSDMAVHVTNNLSQAVNVYVVSTGGGELFLRQIPANTAETVPVTGLATGSPVTFKAVTVDGSRTYQSRTAPLSAAAFLWSVP